VNVSHELKTPVGALTLLAEAVADAVDDPQAVRRFAAQMQGETARLSRLVHEIIELSRLQGAPEGLHLVDVDEVVAEAVDSVATTAAAKQIRVSVAPSGSGSPGGGLRVSGDRRLLVTAVRNLVDNAVAYSSDGTSVTVAVQPGRTDAGEQVVRIVVVDEGVGIPSDLHDRVFERFFRVDPARSRLTGGTGLGLSIVKHVAADHGGDVSVWSQPGRGSTFTIRLPRVDTGPLPLVSQPPVSPSPVSPSRGETSTVAPSPPAPSGGEPSPVVPSPPELSPSVPPRDEPAAAHSAASSGARPGGSGR